MHSVTNILETSDYRYWAAPFKRARTLFVGILVFPNKAWSWYDERPGKLGLHVGMMNLDRNVSWQVTSFNPASPERLPIADYNKEGLILFQLRYLMETQWVFC